MTLHTSARALVCEDDALLALDLERQLEDLGFEILGPFARQSDALRALAAQTPDVAVIDVELADGACTRLAGLLRERGVPTLVVSGFHLSNPPPEYARALWLPKPLEPVALRRALQRRSLPVSEESRTETTAG
jgi:two-component SAPR family response regulator